MQIKIHSKGIVGSSARQEGEEAAALFAGILEIDGELYAEVADMRIDFNSEEFASVTVTFIPGDIQVVNHTEDSWSKIIQEFGEREHRARIRRSDGRVIAIYVSPETNP
jgi:hypothetical protein